MTVMTRKKKRAQEGRTRYSVTAQEFALTWNESSSAQEVADKLGMPLPIVSARVSNYRKKGIKMKKMPRKDSRKLDVDKINEAIANARAKQGGTEHEEQEIIRSLLGVPTELLAKVLATRLGHNK